MLALAAFVFAAADWFYRFEEAKKTLDLIGGLVFSLMAVFQAEELVGLYRKNKEESEKTRDYND